MAAKPSSKTSWKRYLKDLDELYQLALGKENITAALKIKEIQIQTKKEEEEELSKWDPYELSSEHLEHLIERISRRATLEEQRSSK
jgi:hypothetical protein